MADKLPPAWDEADPLSKFFADAEYNDRATAHNFVPIYNLLKKVDGLLRRLEEGVEKNNREELLVSRFLMIRTRSAFLAGIRLAMSGQAAESFPVLRAGVEHAWYSLHMAKDPNPPERATIWLNRNESAAEKARCKAEFTVARVRATHESLDPSTAKSLQEAYDTLIDFGAHPNQFGVMTSMTKSEVGERTTTFSVGILSPQPLHMAFGLRMAVAMALGAIKVFQLIFPERFVLLQLDEATASVVREANNVFKGYAPKPKAQS
jgi:hypothetical protein